MEKFRTMLTSIHIEKLTVLTEGIMKITYMTSSGAIKVENKESILHAWHSTLEIAQEHNLNSLRKRIALNKEQLVRYQSMLDQAIILYSKKS